MSPYLSSTSWARTGVGLATPVTSLPANHPLRVAPNTGSCTVKPTPRNTRVGTAAWGTPGPLHGTRVDDGAGILPTHKPERLVNVLGPNCHFPRIPIYRLPRTLTPLRRDG